MTQSSSPGRPLALPVWPRFAAAALDFLVLLVPEVIAYQLIAGPTLSQALRYYNSHQKLGLANAVAHTPNYQPAVYHFYIAMEAITAAYLIATYLGFSATLGKLALRLRITRVDGSPLRTRDAVLRSLPFWIPLLLPSPVGIYVFFFQFLGGSILIIFRPDHRGPEDLLGNSIVVAKEAQGRSLGEAVSVVRTPSTLRRPTLTPPAPTVARGGHLPGWEPIESPPAEGDADEPDSDLKQEEDP
ncbi:MAG: RDD family protein [Candidatus Dormibacteria bacterium]